MLHAKELRYGNKVQNHHGEVITVQQIFCNTLVYDTQINVSRRESTMERESAVDKNSASDKGSSLKTKYATQFIEVIKEADFQEVEPIALTPQILKQCGFRNFVRDEWIFSIGNSHFDFEFNAGGMRLRNLTPSRVSIQYLHQLQNFLFAIAGYELDPRLEN
jgi:hypothetical protein